MNTRIMCFTIIMRIWTKRLAKGPPRRQYVIRIPARRSAAQSCRVQMGLNTTENRFTHHFCFVLGTGDSTCGWTDNGARKLLRAFAARRLDKALWIHDRRGPAPPPFLYFRRRPAGQGPGRAITYSRRERERRGDQGKGSENKTDKIRTFGRRSRERCYIGRTHDTASFRTCAFWYPITYDIGTIMYNTSEGNGRHMPSFSSRSTPTCSSFQQFNNVNQRCAFFFFLEMFGK